jgi:HEPN domain-containing protein
MSAEKNRLEAFRWLETAREDVTTSAVLLTAGRFAHSCFHSQQAGEKALKAVWYLCGADPWGHSVRKLIEDLGHVDAQVYRVLADLTENAARLDRYYIPTRYPNGLPDITPDQAFFKEDAETALMTSRSIIEHASVLLGKA